MELISKAIKDSNQHKGSLEVNKTKGLEMFSQKNSNNPAKIMQKNTTFYKTEFSKIMILNVRK